MSEPGQITKATLYVELNGKPCIVTTHPEQMENIINYLIASSPDKVLQVVGLPEGCSLELLSELEDEEYLH